MIHLLALVSLAAVPDADVPRSSPSPRLTPPPVSRQGLDAPLPSRGTRCAPCHSVSGWATVAFPHQRTGFPLKGLHSKVDCKACHPVDFVQTVPQACSGCHKDVHTGQLGGRCESCHDENSWRANFSVESHRLTNFPLTGRHAIIPCESCHPAAAQQAFSRSTVECAACHMADYTKAAALGVNHQLLGFGPDCRQCHDGTRFTGARFAQHDACFTISAGAHGGIECLSCHTRVIITGGSCDPSSAGIDCTTCHDHERTKTDNQHHVGMVPCVSPFAPDHVHQVCGYQYQGQLCYGCHQF
jgi:hypothetical protein